MRREERLAILLTIAAGLVTLLALFGAVLLVGWTLGALAGIDVSSLPY